MKNVHFLCNMISDRNNEKFKVQESNESFDCIIDTSYQQAMNLIICKK